MYARSNDMLGGCFSCEWQGDTSGMVSAQLSGHRTLAKIKLQST